MGEFLKQFGVDWKLLLSQLANFTLILIILRIFIYKPLLKALKERKEKIENGLMKAEECDIRLKEVDIMSEKKLKEADEKCVVLLSQSDIKRKKLEKEITLQVKHKEEELIRKAKQLAENQKKEMYEKLIGEAGEIIRSAIAKAIEVEPEEIDKKLVKRAKLVLEKENELQS